MDLLLIKSLHIIFVVTWFAGIFYIVRLFIYDTEANDKPKAEKKILQAQFKIMQKRLWYGITWPSAILTLVFGSSMLHHFMPLSNHPWLAVKLCFILGLFIYHLYLGKIYNDLKKGIYKRSSTYLRVINELATLFLFSIVFLAVMKNSLDMLKTLGGLVIISLFLMSAIKIYKNIRQSK